MERQIIIVEGMPAGACVVTDTEVFCAGADVEQYELEESKVNDVSFVQLSVDISHRPD